MSKKRRLLDQSYAWIRANLHATNLDVPDELVSPWMFEDDEDGQRPKGFYFSVFAFGCMHFDVLTSSLPPKVPLRVELNQLLHRFDRWQLKLALTEIHRRTDVRMAPLPLFSFPEGEEVQFWPGARSGS